MSEQDKGLVEIEHAPLSYPVACASCHETFDALVAEWCGCLVSERTPLCPHCGRCFCRSTPAYKSQFWSGAPREMWAAKWRDHDARAVEETSADETALLRPLILVVDDEPAIRRIAARFLKGMGYGVAIARDGLEGLARARTLQPDLILTDALMPKMDGREMSRQLKSDPATASMRVVLMTSLYTSMKYRLEGFKRYLVNDYVAKPVSPDELREVVERNLANLATAPQRESRPSLSTTPQLTLQGGVQC